MKCHAAIETEEIVKRRLNSRVKAFQWIDECQRLVLRGQGQTYYAKQLAQQFVMDATTVAIRANEIEVLSAVKEPNT